MADAIIALSARETAAAVRSGRLAPAAVARAFAERIAAIEPEVLAWAWFDPEQAIEAAGRVDPAGPLAGVTFGIKDVIDTVDLPTGYGSALYAGTRPPWDAPCVTRARALGGIVMGKTVSTEFAMSSPGQTRNPHDRGHTPGGSSSGSAAAVAAGMVQVAYGTQTAGSLIRPASFCGVVAYKPSFGLLNRTGIKVLAENLDTLGVITRDVRDAAFVTAALAEKPELAIEGRAIPPRIGRFRTSRWAEAGEATRTALDRTAAALAAAGARVVDVPVPDWFDELYPMHDAVMGWETARSLAYEYRVMAERISPVTRAFLDQLARATRGQYEAALAACERRRQWLDELLADCDALLAPAAPGEAPAGLASTGDPVFNKPWTLLHGPCVAVPAGLGPNALPVGVQLVGRLGDDAGLLNAAAFTEDALASQEQGEARGHQ